MYFIWYIAFIESYYCPCVKKIIEQIYQNMCPLSRKMFVMAYLSLQNILFIDLVDDNVFTKFGLNRSIRFQDIEQKLNSDVNQGQ